MGTISGDDKRNSGTLPNTKQYIYCIDIITVSIIKINILSGVNLIAMKSNYKRAYCKSEINMLYLVFYSIVSNWKWYILI